VIDRKRTVTVFSDGIFRAGAVIVDLLKVIRSEIDIITRSAIETLDFGGGFDAIVAICSVNDIVIVFGV